MKTKLVLIYLLLLTLYSYSQEKIASFVEKNNKQKNMFSLIDEKNQLTLFSCTNKYITAMEFDESFKIIDSLGIKLPKKQFSDIIGSTKKNEDYYIYWNSEKENEYIIQKFDFKEKKVWQTTKTFDLGKERIINKISIENKFYIVSVLKNTSVVNFYCFEGNELEKKSIDCSNLRFLSGDNKFVTFWNLCLEKGGTPYNEKVMTILGETPASLVNSTYKKKSYIDKNALLFTFDNNDSFTQVIRFNLDDFSVTQKSIPLPFVHKQEGEIIETNSFYIENKLIQIKANATILFLAVKDIDGNELQKFTFAAGDEIAIRNSDIIQENGSIKSPRILDTSNQLIRKIRNLNSAVSCYSKDNKYYLILGGVSYPQQNQNVMIGGMLGGFVGAAIGAALTNNYSLNNINSYSNKKIVYINSVFDSNFVHIDGSAQKLAFDKVRLFVEENNEYINQTVFKLKNILYYSGLNKETKEYSFFAFKD
jgi:hypothetical protein